MMSPLVTVGLPVFDSGDISWLAIESLCLQDTIVPWQLCVCEEREGASVDKLIDDNEDRLVAAGCIDVKYLSTDMWLPLPIKYRRLYDMADGGIFMMQAADCWSHKNRVQNAYDAITAGADWFQSKRGLFYHIGIGVTILYDWDTVTTGHPCGPDMSWKTELMRHIPFSWKRKGIDKLLYNSMMVGEMRHLDVTWEGEDEMLSLNTHGANKISIGRGGHFVDMRMPFVHTDIDGLSVLPDEIAQRLRNMLGYGII